MTDDTSRRRFMIAGAAVVAAGMAGCNSDGGDDGDGNGADGNDGAGGGGTDPGAGGDTAEPTATAAGDDSAGAEGTGATDDPTDTPTGGDDSSGDTDDGGSGGGGQQDLRQLSVGESAQGFIDEGDPSDPQFDALGEPVEFSASSGDTVQVGMQSEAFDAYLLLLGPDDDWIAEDDDSGEGTNSQLTAELSADGTHTAWALSFSGSATGSYTISISSA